MSFSDELRKISELHAQGHLSDDEFAAAKARLIGQPAAAQAPQVDQAGLASAVNRFRRSRRDAWLGGVCGGLSVSTGLAAWAWRLLFIALLLCGGTGLVLYVLLWALVPAADDAAPPLPAPAGSAAA